MTETGIEFAIVDGVAHIELRRPDSANAIDLTMAKALRHAVAQTAMAAEARVILISGAGARFCAGGDVTTMARANDPADYLRELANEVDAALQQLDSLDVPVIAKVQGVAAGAGLAVALAADIIVSAASTRYLTAYVGVGLTPDCGLSWLLPRAIGQPRALDLMLTGRVLSASEANDWGLISRTVPDHELDDEVAVLVDRLVKAPPFAVGQARRLVRSSWSTSRAGAGDDEVVTISKAVARPEAKTLLARFSQRQ